MTYLKNSNFKDYLYYLLKKCLLRNIVFFALSFAFSLSVRHSFIPSGNSGLSVLVLMLVLLCSVITVLTFSDFNKKRNLDSLYSLPISRKSLLLAHYLCGGISILFVFTASYTVCFGYLLMHSSQYNLGYMLLYYPVAVFYGFIMYSFFSFIFTRANTTFDGIVFCFFWSFLITVLILGIYSWADTLSIPLPELKDEYLAYGFFYTPTILASQLFQMLIEVRRNVNFNTAGMIILAVSSVIWAVIGIASLFGMLNFFPKKEAQKTGDISESIFGYKFIIPAMSLSLINLLSAFVLNIILLICTVIGYTVYRRGFKYKASDLIVIAISLILVFKSILSFYYNI